jgi:hypothetical protein
MRLFHRRASKRLDKAEATLVEQPASAAQPAAAPVQPQATVAQPAAAPVQQPASAAQSEADVTRQHRLAEGRPDPDQPGWGRTIGQAISKARQENGSQP